MIELIESFFAKFATLCEDRLFFDVFDPFHSDVLPKLPFLLFIFCVAAVWFSVYLKFPNFRFFRKALRLFAEKEKEGEKTITSRSAFLTAISSCVGVGNITGVAAAVYFGGPGAVFWMFALGFLITPVRFAEVLLGHKYRTIDASGEVTECGPFAYIRKGLPEVGLAKIAPFFAKFFAISLVLASIGAITIQTNQATDLLTNAISTPESLNFVKMIFGTIICGVFLAVVVGGFKRIVHVAEKLIIVKSVTYICLLVFIISINYSHFFEAMQIIVSSAFNPVAIKGGTFGIIFIAMQRVLVSTEVGFGTVSLIHGRTKNPDSVKEALLSMMGPFVGNSTFIALNGIAVVMTGFYRSPEKGIMMIANMVKANGGNPLFWYFCTIVSVFAFATIIAWYYYAENSIRKITNRKFAITIYQGFCVTLIFMSCFVSFCVMLKIIDIVTIFMLVPNLTILLLLSKKVKGALSDYEKSNKCRKIK